MIVHFDRLPQRTDWESPTHIDTRTKSWFHAGGETSLSRRGPVCDMGVSTTLPGGHYRYKSVENHLGVIIERLWISADLIDVGDIVAQNNSQVLFPIMTRRIQFSPEFKFSSFIYSANIMAWHKLFNPDLCLTMTITRMRQLITYLWDILRLGTAPNVVPWIDNLVDVSCENYLSHILQNLVESNVAALREFMTSLAKHSCWLNDPISLLCLSHQTVTPKMLNPFLHTSFGSGAFEAAHSSKQDKWKLELNTGSLLDGEELDGTQVSDLAQIGRMVALNDLLALPGEFSVKIEFPKITYMELTPFIYNKQESYQKWQLAEYLYHAIANWFPHHRALATSSVTLHKSWNEEIILSINNAHSRDTVLVADLVDFILCNPILSFV